MLASAKLRFQRLFPAENLLPLATRTEREIALKIYRKYCRRGIPTNATLQ